MEASRDLAARRYLYLTASFVTLLVVANIVSAKVVEIGGWILPAAVIGYPFTYLLTDAINELYGERRARQVVLAGFWANVLMLVFVQATIWLPPAPFWPHQAAYEAVMSSSWRIVAASLLSYFVAQWTDVRLFHLIRRRTGEKHFWLRKNASTAVSQLLDTVLFITVAFAGTMPAAGLLTMIVSQYLVKTAIAVIDTPFSYLLVKRLRSAGPAAVPGRS